MAEEFKTNRKIRIGRNKYSKFPVHSSPYPFRLRSERTSKYAGRMINKHGWWLQCDDIAFDYHIQTKRWVVSRGDLPLDVWVSNTARVPSLKALVRHLRKQELPKGITFTFAGRYVGEEYTVFVS